MIGASSLAFPGSKTLASWWRQLAAWQPLAFWVGHLFVHRVEALAGAWQAHPLDRFSLLLLQALALEGATAETNASNATADAPAPIGVDRLDARLGLGPALLQQILRQLAAQGLVEADARGQWTTTPQGRQALQHGSFRHFRYDRRVFPFVECVKATGERLAPPHFLALREVAGTPWQLGDDSLFQVAWLQACLDQEDAWKNLFGFAPEVCHIAGLSPAPSLNHQASPEDVPPWRQVVVDHPERFLVVLVQSGTDPAAPQLLGLAARQEGWSLQTQEPLFALSQQAWPDVFPELTTSSQEENCRLAWRNWGKTAGLQAAEVDSCTVTFAPGHLHVQAPAAVVRRLRAMRSDVFKGDTWVLVGEGRVRAALALVIGETEKT